MKLKFYCKNSEFKNIDMFFNEQEYQEPPDFNEIELITDSNIYKYKVQNEFNNWYIVTA